MNLHDLVPFVQEFTEQHTGRNIKFKLDYLLKGLELYNADCEKHMILDSAANNKLGRKLSTQLMALYCAIHKLQRCAVCASTKLAAQSAITQVMKMTRKTQIKLRLTKTNLTWAR